MFQDTGVQVKVDVDRHLGAVLGSESFEHESAEGGDWILGQGTELIFGEFKHCFVKNRKRRIVRK